MPARVVAVGAYYRLLAIESAHVETKAIVTVIEAKLNEKSDKLLLLEQKQETMKALDNMTQSNSVKALERIESELKLMQADVKDIRNTQAQMMTSVR